MKKPEIYVFDTAQLEKLKTKPCTYAIGVDTYDKKSFSYCVARKCDGITEILLAKTMKKEIKFNEEVKNLMKYFNAVKIIEN